MISKWLEQAKRGQTVWLPDVREGCARMEDAVPVTMQLTLCDGSKRDFSLPLPRWQNEQEQQFVKQYVTACVYNTLSACSGREMAFYLDARESEAAALLGQLDEVFQVRRTARSGYGKVINIADRLCRAFGGGGAMMPSAVGLAAGFQSYSFTHTSRPSAATAALISVPPMSMPHNRTSASHKKRIN